MVDPEKLRAIADYLDAVDSVMRNVWEMSIDERKDEFLRFLNEKEMQNDLRAWADELEAG